MQGGGPMWPEQMTLEEYLELRREAREAGWNIDVLEMFLTFFDLRNGRNATTEEVRGFFNQKQKEVESAAE